MEAPDAPAPIPIVVAAVFPLKVAVAADAPVERAAVSPLSVNPSEARERFPPFESKVFPEAITTEVAL